MYKYEAEIESRIAGIPCLIGVITFTRVRPSYSHRAASDLDYYGYTESEWEVLDRRGRPAPWLERKLTQSAKEQIEVDIVEYMGEQS